MQEIWKDIPDYEGYQVSSLGRIRTYNKITYTEKHGNRHWKNRILKYKGNTYKTGYKTGYRVDLWKNGKPYTKLVARLVAFTFYNQDINNHELTVDHLDGNRLNNRLDNLEIVSLKENIQRAFKNNLMVQKNVELFDKNKKTTQIFNSMNKASCYMNRGNGYISAKVKENIFEDKYYTWKILN